MTDDDLTRLRDEVAGVLGEHESLLGSDDYTSCVCGEQTGTLGGLRAHVADALLPLLARKIAEARAEALREAADGLALRRLGMAFDDPWRKGWNRALEVARDDLATLAEPTGPEER